MRRVAVEHSVNSPRSLQRPLGPSELGTECDRQVVGKMAGVRRENEVVDPWPSIVGVAVHRWLADAFTTDNLRTGVLRWVAEQRVSPYPGYEYDGTADLYDAQEFAVVDHKCLSDDSLDKIRSATGPPRRYFVQLLLYGLGYRHLGLPVRRVALVIWPRTKSTLDRLYVWDHEWTDADDALLQLVFEQTRQRALVAQLVATGAVDLMHVTAHPDDDECYFCPFYRPQSATDSGPGCPGTVQHR